MRRLRELDKPVDWAYEMVFAALLGGLVGSRLDFVIQNWDGVSDDLLGNFFSGSGLVWFGGVVGGALGVLLWARWRGFLELRLLDLCAPALALGYAIGRVGCQLSGDGDYGKPSDLPWAMAYPEGTVPTPRGRGAPDADLRDARDGPRRARALAPARPLQAGRLFALYLVLAGIERLLIEFIRRNDDVVAGLTFPQLVSLGLIAAGGVWLMRLRSGGGLAGTG